MTRTRRLDTLSLEQLDARIQGEQSARLERLLLVQRARVKSPHWTVVMAALDRCFERQPIREEPPCLALAGPRGSGKTTVAEAFLATHPPTETPDGIERPVVYCMVPSHATIHSLTAELLREMGDPRHDRGTLIIKTGRLRDLLHACKTRVLILDEINNLVEGTTGNELGAGADWLKNLIKHRETRLSVVLVGLEDEVNALVGANKDQLARFFPDPIVFRALEWNVRVRDDDTEYYIFLEQLEPLLPFEATGYLANRDCAWRCYCASEGVMAYTMKLVRSACEIAIDTGASYPDQQLFAQAFDEQLAGVRRNVPNPFIGPRPAAPKPRPGDGVAGSDTPTTPPRRGPSRGGVGAHGRRPRAPRRETVRSVLARG